jgi:hypothetical protein
MRSRIREFGSATLLTAASSEFSFSVAAQAIRGGMFRWDWQVFLANKSGYRNHVDAVVFRAAVLRARSDEDRRGSLSRELGIQRRDLLAFALPTEIELHSRSATNTEVPAINRIRG